MNLLDLLAADADAPEVRRRLSAAGVLNPPDRIGDPPVATYRVRTSVDGELTVVFAYRRSEGRSRALTVAGQALVGTARIELEPMP